MRKTRREKKRGKKLISQGKAALQMTAVSEQWTWSKAVCELAGAACRAQAGAQSLWQRDGEEAGEHWRSGSPKSPPQKKAEGWDAGRE